VLKVKLWQVSIVIILIGILYFWLSGFSVNNKTVTPITPITPESQTLEPSIENTPPDQEKKTPIKSSKDIDVNDKDTLKLSPPEEDYLSTSRPNVEFSCSLKKDNKERIILPGVTYKSGEGVNVKLDDEQETIQIKRDSTYHPNEYQVVWKKKY
jgi:hypothetical protein